MVVRIKGREVEVIIDNVGNRILDSAGDELFTMMTGTNMFWFESSVLKLGITVSHCE